MRRIGPLVLFGALLFPVSSFASVIIFNTYGPGNTYDLTRGYTVGQGSTSGNLFTPTATGALQEIDLALGHASGGNIVSVELRNNDTSTNTPSTLIETYSVNVTNTFGTTGAFVVATSALHPILDVSKSYWILMTSDAVSNNPWYFNNIGTTGPRYANAFIFNDDMAAFSVVDSELFSPEPATFIPMLSGVAVLWGGISLRRRRAAATRSN